VSMDGPRCVVLGRLGAGASVRYPQAGTPLVGCSAAVHDGRAGTEASAEWVNVAHVGDPVDELAPQLHKGSFVYVEDRLRLAQWTNTDGERKSALDITTSRSEVLGAFSRKHEAVA
jgi:single-stranded DNA-binding protein